MLGRGRVPLCVVKIIGQLCAYDCYVNIMWLPYCKCSSAGRLLGAYNLGVATPRALVHAGDKTSGDARSWYMISGDAKSWVVIVLHIFIVILHNCPLFEILAQRLESSSFEQSISSDDLVSSKGPSKVLLKWYEDATDKDATDEDIKEFMF
ncbi:hypothetical protein Tco_0899668 [Tanacetum coccineum]